MKRVFCSLVHYNNGPNTNLVFWWLSPQPEWIVGCKSVRIILRKVDGSVLCRTSEDDAGADGNQIIYCGYLPITR